MKKIVSFILALMLIALPLTSCGAANTGEAPMGFVEISDDGLSYNLYVPDEWTPDLSTGVTSAYFDGRDPSNISMMAFELDRTITSLEDYWTSYEPDLKAIFPDLAYVDTAEATLDGVPAMQYIYTASMSGLSYKIMQLTAIRNNTIYIFTYTATADKYDAHIEDVIAMLDYFCFTE
ncbi:MAG: DUF1795 domain-containing protein [Ruminococcaceae bacterium]|nr:DUF1795 domain-containing protein [Oscillospiraceae bacterium]